MLEWVVVRLRPKTKNIVYIREEADVVTIDYARESNGNEQLMTLIRLTQAQIDKLRERRLARNMYVSPRCSASMKLEARDKKPNTCWHCLSWSINSEFEDVCGLVEEYGYDIIPIADRILMVTLWHQVQSRVKGLVLIHNSEHSAQPVPLP
ncbi:uncharacterized protein EV154DRAFT_481411 [Mucor mucedo]|uniref:uncharacterized protein n=1 Tax=Mucor mucedo TaxID=29922 RepID=UPI00222011F8|nr:uncharacterized protein EV154DRAFT_481411 [Mucor mucedo]KAI7891158.1 hypothetical protein EV154DRAFT_481411 [Mucor mucedo]